MWSSPLQMRELTHTAKREAPDYDVITIRATVREGRVNFSPLAELTERVQACAMFRSAD